MDDSLTVPFRFQPSLHLCESGRAGLKTMAASPNRNRSRLGIDLVKNLKI